MISASPNKRGGRCRAAENASQGAAANVAEIVPCSYNYSNVH